MPFYMHQWVYKDSLVGAMVRNPENRAEIVRLATEAFGGKLHQFFFTLGEYGGVSIAEFPDNEAAMAAMIAAVGQGGLVSMKSTVLLTPEEAEQAMLKANAVVRPE